VVLTAAFGVAAALVNRFAGTLWASILAHACADVVLIAEVLGG
jgi:membrane protease YdiL (CAAX protease family)